MPRADNGANTYDVYVDCTHTERGVFGKQHALSSQHQQLFFQIELRLPLTLLLCADRGPLKRPNRTGLPRKGLAAIAWLGCSQKTDSRLPHPPEASSPFILMVLRQPFRHHTMPSWIKGTILKRTKYTHRLPCSHQSQATGCLQLTHVDHQQPRSS